MSSLCATGRIYALSDWVTSKTFICITEEDWFRVLSVLKDVCFVQHVFYSSGTKV